MEPLLPSFRRELRARAHHLAPVVSIGQHGLTPAVLHEIDVALAAHGLIKVRVFGDDREARDAMLARICGEMDCAAVQQIGKLLVLWRPREADDTGEPPAKRPGEREARLDRRERNAPASRRRRAGAPDAGPTSAGHTGGAKAKARAPSPRSRGSAASIEPPHSGRRKGKATPDARAPRSPGKAPPAATSRAPRSPGKAPAGVPRAAAPRRRRRAP